MTTPLPNADRAFIDERKIVGYLLSDSHPEGAPKARFLKSFGFSAALPDILRGALLDHATRHDPTSSRVTEFGSVFEINGRLTSPDGQNPWMLVVWMIDNGTDFPRFIIAVPSHEARP